MNILVTGASKGIGQNIARTLLECGHEVFCTGRDETALSEYKNRIIADLSKTEDIKKLGEYAIFNCIDVLINNAGEYIYSEIENMSFEQISRIIRVNTEVPFYLTSKVVPYMKQKKWGRIINIGSISGVMGETCASIYSASKSALIGGTKALALELAEYGITANTINPGWVDTQMGNNSAEDGDWSKDEILSCIPQKRFVSPREISGFIKYLISDEAKGLTGQSVNICAGLSVGY